MRRKLMVLVLAGVAVAGCNEQPRETNQPPIKVRSAEQDQLHTLDAFNLAIGLKRAIYAAGYRCQRVTDAGFVGPYQNLDMWVAKCSEGREWAIFAGPDGSAQVRDCRDVPGTGTPLCEIKKRPKGSFTEIG